MYFTLNKIRMQTNYTISRGGVVSQLGGLYPPSWGVYKYMTEEEGSEEGVDGYDQ